MTVVNKLDKFLKATSLALAAVSIVGVLPSIANDEPLTGEAETTLVAANPVTAATVAADGRAQKGLNLSDAQLEKIYALKNQLADAVGPKKEELKSASRKLKDLLTQPNLDRGAIKATQDKINALRSDIANQKLAFRIDMSEQLTPEQKEQMRLHSIKRGMGHKHHRGGFRGKSRGPAQT